MNINRLMGNNPMSAWCLQTLDTIHSLAPDVLSDTGAIRWANSKCLITDHEMVQLEAFIYRRAIREITQ